MKLSIVVPCHNEGDNLAPLLEKFKEAIGARGDVEVIVVDNASVDNTAQIIKELCVSFSFMRSVYEAKPGYGAAVVAGLRTAKGEYIGWTHGDLQTPPADVLRALEIINKYGNPKRVYLKGLRSGRPLFDRIFTFGMSVFESIYFGTILYDINAQPNIFHHDFLKEWDDPPTDFSLDLYALYLAKKRGLALFRFKVWFGKRLHGQSHWNTDFWAKMSFIKRTLSFSFVLKKRAKGWIFNGNDKI